MFRTLAILFGSVLIVVGILGFVPGVTPNEHLLGIFHVNAAHNAVHLLSGLVSLMAGLSSEYFSRMFFRFFGVIYGLVALLGFVYGDRMILGLISNNRADTWLHVGVAAVSLLVGYALDESAVAKSRRRATA